MFQMIVVWALVAFSADQPDVCSPTLQGRAPDMGAISADVPNEAKVESNNQLDIRMINNHSLMVVSRRSDLPDLSINGSAAAFTWHNAKNIAAVVLEQCGLGESALAVTAGPAYGDWIGPNFFDSRPELGAEASLLRTMSFSSKALGEDRDVYLVVGEGWNGAEGDPLLISGDGLAGGPYGAIVEALSKSDNVRPIAFASSRFGEGRLSDVGIPLRSAEYHVPAESAPNSRKAAYAAHEVFFFDEFLPFIINELGGEAGPVYTFGISASATFALEQGLKRDAVISGVIAGSPPIRSTTGPLASQAKADQIVRLWCGTLEHLLCNQIRVFAEKYGYSLQTRHASHVSALWEEALSVSLLELFPARTK